MRAGEKKTLHVDAIRTPEAKRGAGRMGERKRNRSQKQQLEGKRDRPSRSVEEGISNWGRGRGFDDRSDGVHSHFRKKRRGKR